MQRDSQIVSGREGTTSWTQWQKVEKHIPNFNQVSSKCILRTSEKFPIVLNLSVEPSTSVHKCLQTADTKIIIYNQLKIDTYISWDTE